LELLDACLTEAGATTGKLAWVTEYPAAYWTFCLEGTWRWFNKFAFITSKVFLLTWIASLSSFLQWWSWLDIDRSIITLHILSKNATEECYEYVGRVAH